MRLLDSPDFAAARYPVALEGDEIQLWWFGDAPRDRAATLLSNLLAAYLDCFSGELVIGRGEFGKPHVLAPAALEFNLSHSGSGILVGVSRSQALGVDIEALYRRRPVLELARRFFAPAEADALQRLEVERQQAAFLGLWSCKEAVVKALGRGIGFGLSRLAFDLNEDGTPTRLNVIDASAGGVAEWHIVCLRPRQDHVGSLAWRGPGVSVRAFNAALP